MNVIDWLPVRQVTDPQQGNVLRDISSHLPAGNVYWDDDPVTAAHEQTHGINSNIRNAHAHTYGKVKSVKRLIQEPCGNTEVDCILGDTRNNGFYILGDRAVLIPEPSVRISDVAAAVPSTLHGSVFELYLIKSGQSWNDTPLYLCDEWTGYTNGSACGIDLSMLGLWERGPRSETVQYMMEFCVYTTVMYGLVKNPMAQLTDFMRDRLSYCFDLYKKSLGFPNFASSAAESYLLAARKTMVWGQINRLLDQGHVDWDTIF